MSIWARTLIVVISLGLILLTIALLLTAWEHAGMEKVLAHRQDELYSLLSNSIAISSKSLSAFTYDYTYWDDMVAFMQTGDPVWAKENLLDSIETYDVTVLWIYRTDYILHYSITSDGEPAPEIPGIPRLLPAIFEKDRFLHFFLQTPQGLLELRGASIHPTADKDRITPPRGYFIAGRYWNTEYLSTLTSLTGGHIELSNQPPLALERPHHSFKNGEYVIHKELPGVDGLPIAWAAAHIPSPAAANYIYTLWWSIGLNASLLTAIVGLVALILYFWVVRPLRLIRSTLNSGNTLPLTRIEWISTEFRDIAEVIRRSFHQQHQMQWQSSLNAALADLYEPLTSPSTSIQDTAKLILHYAQTLTQSPDGFVFEVHPVSGMILDHAVAALFEKDAQGVFERLKYALSSEFDETGSGKEPPAPSLHSGFFKNDLSALADTLGAPLLQPPLQRLLTVPILLDGKHAGSITLVNKDQDYTDADLHAVQRLAQFFALTIQRKRVETDLRRLAAAIEQAAEIVVVAGMQGEAQYVNPAFERATGRTSGEVLGESLCSLLSGDASGHPALWNDMQNALRQHGGWSGLLTNRKQNSSLLRLETTVFPVQDDFGAITNLVAVSRDITRETDLQEQLRQSQKMEAVGQLAGGVAHDFNNLLQVITGYTDLALASVESESLAAQSLQEILNASERARALVNQLLLFSRRQVQQPKNINLSETVESAMKLLGRVIGEHIERIFNGCDDIKPVRADPNQVLQVLMNLCVNAQDAMPKGGRLTIAVYRAELDEAFCTAHPWAREGEFAALSVQDTGLGMTPEIKAHIFEPFFSTKEVGKGTGLGLATVYGIVKQHDGLLHVESEPGKGSTFFVYLPVAQDAPVDTAGLSEHLEALGGKGETILLAEDEENVRYLTTRMLRSKGYRPIMARDGEEAIQLLHQHIGELKLVVVDAVMPKKSGRDVYDAVRASRADLPVLFVSGYSYDVLEGGSKLVNAALLPKPFRPQELLLKIREMLDHTPTRSSE